MGGGDACNLYQWGLRCSTLQGHQPCEGCAVIGGGDECKLCPWLLVELPIRPRAVRGVCRNVWRGRMYPAPPGPFLKWPRTV
eukprot:3393967-Pyramimonas_sp.AAC.1